MLYPLYNPSVMTKKIFKIFLTLGIALAIALSFAGGWLAAELHAEANPPNFKILEDYKDEITLIKLESFDGKFLKGSYEGDQPRFLIGEKEKLAIPEKDKRFQIDLSIFKK